MKHAFGLVILAACLLSACKHKGDTPTQAAPVKVSVEVVGGSDYAVGSVYSGTVESANTTTVSFAVAGTIEQLSAAEGQRVSRGQVLGHLKDGDYVNAHNIALAELAEAQDAYERLKKLHDANALPDIKWVEIQQKLKQAQNAADMAARAVQETSLRSPMDGVISRKIADRGQNVAPIEPVYEIVSTDNLTINISVPENEVGRFAVGREATVAIQGHEPVTGKVTQKSVVADPLTRSYKIKVSLPSASGKVLPGMVGTVAFAADDADVTAAAQAFMLPSQAVNLSDDNRTFVWVVIKGRAERRFVTADELVAGGILVKEGLAPGDTVIVAGMQKVGTGSEVVAEVR